MACPFDSGNHAFDLLQKIESQEFLLILAHRAQSLQFVPCVNVRVYATIKGELERILIQKLNIERLPFIIDIDHKETLKQLRTQVNQNVVRYGAVYCSIR